MIRRVHYSTPPHLLTLPVLRKLFIYALPIALGTLVLPLSQNIDNATVIRQLMATGLSSLQATKEYGIYAGEALRLMQLPLSFATAIGASIMPAITEALARGQHAEGRHRLLDSLRMTAFITFPAAITLAGLALPLDIAFFKHAQGAQLFVIASVISIFSALELVTTYILQGYDRFYQPVLHMGIGLVIKFAGNLILIPLLGINGAAIASVVGYGVSSWLNMSAVRRATGQPISFPRVAWRPAVAALCTGVWMFSLSYLYDPVAHALQMTDSRLLALFFILIGVAVGAPVYVLSALWVRAIAPGELDRVPMVGRILVRVIKRLPAVR